MTQELFDVYTAFLAQVLTPARLRHSTGAMQVMGELAGVYQLDRRTAMAIGLLHDAAKDFTPDQQAAMVAESGVTIRYPSEHNYNLYLHGPVSAYFVQKALGITDPLILEAIYRHTWVGEEDGFDCRYVWAMRFADILEPYRNWDDHAHIIREAVPALRAAAYSGRLEEAACRQIEMITRFFEETGLPVHPNYSLARQALSKIKTTEDTRQ